MKRKVQKYYTYKNGRWCTFNINGWGQKFQLKKPI